jgi:hypothetical protein
MAMASNLSQVRRSSSRSQNFGRYLIPLLAIPQLMLGQSSLPISRQLLALRPGMTAQVWLSRHPRDRFEPYPSAERQGVQHEWCAVATASSGPGQLVRHAYFYFPDTRTLTLPKDNVPHPELTMQCRLEEIRVEIKASRVILSGQLSEAKRQLERIFGNPLPFNSDYRKDALLEGSAGWMDGEEWHVQGSRWIVAIDPANGRFVGLALSQTANERDFISDSEPLEFSLARRFLGMSGMSQPDLDQMSELLGKSGTAMVTPPSPAITPFLVRWVKQSAELPMESRSANFFVADAALRRNIYIRGPNNDDKALADEPAAREELRTAGANFQYDELGGDFTYVGEWLRAAWDVAPESEPGMAAFLFLLDSSFELGCCCPAGLTGYENVIRVGTQYLDTHPVSPIRVSVMLRVADAYKDEVILAFGYELTGFGAPTSQTIGIDLPLPKPEELDAFKLALKFYREVIASTPDSEEGRQAKARAWRLMANAKVLPTRFVCLYD